jgi:acyl-coenzyme A synthetase/AMP-(fatty) acid ligase
MELPYPKEDDGLIKGPPVALFMESDVGLWVHLLALISLGVPVLLLSARLSPTAISHLLVITGARAIVASPRLYSTAQEGGALLQSDQLQPILYERNSYEYFLAHGGAPVPSDRKICVPGYHSDEKDRQVIILHSSGTTGLPKPIYQSHEYLLAFAVAHAFSSDEEAQHLNLSTLPLYHVSPTSLFPHLTGILPHLRWGINRLWQSPLPPSCIEIQFMMSYLLITHYRDLDLSLHASQ